VDVFMQVMVRGGLKTLAFAVAGVVATGFVASSALATFPGSNGRIAFLGRIAFVDKPMPRCSTEPHEAHICSIKPDGSGLKRLSSFGSQPSWSANGRRLVFSARWIWTMKADGTDKTKVPSTRGYSYRSASFSPSGGRIVYNDGRPDAPPE
jgi:Tol biopolymer transport system component